MIDPEAQTLPFVTRNQLAFESGTVFSLQIATTATVAGTITIRGMTREGTFTLRTTTTSAGVLTTETFRIPDIPIMVSIQDAGATFKQGQCFATLNLLVNGDVLYALCSGFVSSLKAISYPSSITIDPMPGRGRFRTTSVATSGAGQETGATVPSNRIWRPIAIFVQLVTSATAASRRVVFRFVTQDGMDLRTWSSIDQTASQTENYSVGQYGGGLSEQTGTNIKMEMPREIYLKEDDFITTATANIQAGDAYGTFFLLFEEFFT